MRAGKIATILLPGIGLRASTFLTNFERTQRNALRNYLCFSVSLLLNATFKVSNIQAQLLKYNYSPGIL